MGDKKRREKNREFTTRIYNKCDQQIILAFSLWDKYVLSHYSNFRHIGMKYFETKDTINHIGAMIKGKEKSSVIYAYIVNRQHLCSSDHRIQECLESIKALMIAHDKNYHHGIKHKKPENLPASSIECLVLADDSE